MTQEGLQGENGFQQCLRLTLYRPRDLLLLLNEAFRRARIAERHAIIPTDISDSARSISENRLADLVKEYESQIPALPKLVARFANHAPVLSVKDAADEVEDVTSSDAYDSRIQQDMMLLAEPVEAIRILYSVGFFGVKDSSSGHLTERLMIMFVTTDIAAQQLTASHAMLASTLHSIPLQDLSATARFWPASVMAPLS